MKSIGIVLFENSETIFEKEFSTNLGVGYLELASENISLTNFSFKKELMVKLHRYESKQSFYSMIYTLFSTYFKTNKRVIGVEIRLVDDEKEIPIVTRIKKFDVIGRDGKDSYDIAKRLVRHSCRVIEFLDKGIIGNRSNKINNQRSGFY